MIDQDSFASAVPRGNKARDGQWENGEIHVSASIPPVFWRVLTALCGIAGVAALGYYYSVPFPFPPPSAAAEQLMAFVSRYHDTILLDTWLQGLGSLLIVAFFVALVSLSGAAHRFAGLMALLASTVNFGLALVDVVFGIAAVQSAASGHPTTGVISFDLTNVFVHVFPMLPAPVLFISIGAVRLSARLLPRVFGFLALVLGAAFAILGFLGLFNETALGLTIVLQIGQELWIVAAAITLTLIHGRTEPVGAVEPTVDRPAATA